MSASRGGGNVVDEKPQGKVCHFQCSRIRCKLRSKPVGPRIAVRPSARGSIVVITVAVTIVIGAAPRVGQDSTSVARQQRARVVEAFLEVSKRQLHPLDLFLRQLQRLRQQDSLNALGARRGGGRAPIAIGGPQRRTEDLEVEMLHLEPAAGLNGEVVEGRDDNELSERLLRSALRRHPDTVAVYNVGAANRAAAGALEAGIAREQPVSIGHELTRFTRPMLRSGTMTMVIDQNLEQQARFALDVLMHHFGHVEVKGDCPPYKSTVPFSIFGPEYVPPL